MSYAPHSNTNVHYQRLSGITTLPILLGQFEHKETGAHFEYGERRWPTDDFPEPFAAEFPHMLYTIDGPRLCRVLKTVAHVLTGDGIIEIWPLKRHNQYPIDWIGN